MEIVLLIAISIGAGWIICGVLTYGLTLAEFQREYPSLAKRFKADDIRFALVMGIFGPISLASYLIDGNRPKHGFMWK